MSEAKNVSQEATNSDGNTFIGDHGLINNGIVNLGIASVIEDMGIIASIFSYVSDNVKSCLNYDNSQPPKDWVKTSEKIKINFAGDERGVVAEYYRNALPKVRMIEDYFQTLDSENQADLHNHMCGIYNTNKMNGMSTIKNLHSLFSEVVPVGQKMNAHYTSMAKALVLFFFEDCTIFEKIASEQNGSGQLSLWQLL